MSKYLLSLALLCCTLSAFAQTIGTVSNTTIETPTSGKFDWMKFDAKRRRVLAGHRDAGMLEVLNLDGNKLNSVRVGRVQGVDFDNEGHYFAGDEDDQKLVVMTADKFETIAEIKTPGPIDAIAYCPANGKVYADHDDGSDVWVIDPKTKKLETTINVGGAPEYIEFNNTTGFLYQNVKSKNEIVVIDPKKNQVIQEFSTLPAEGPHGLAIDERLGIIYTAGRNGKLVAIDANSGKVTHKFDIAPGVDQIVLDHQKNVVYCACKGVISAVPIGDAGKQPFNIQSPAGAHTITVDEQTGTVWVCYTNGKHAYLEGINPQAQK